MTDLSKSDEPTLRRFDPFADLRDRMWGFPTRMPGPWFDPIDTGFVPAADVEETDDAWVVDVELAGVDKSDIEIEIRGRTVTISGERKEKERDGVLRKKERVTGTFRYEVTLPGELDADNVEANLDQGELIVRLPKADAKKPQKITIT